MTASVFTGGVSDRQVGLYARAGLIDPFRWFRETEDFAHVNPERFVLSAAGSGTFIGGASEAGGGGIARLATGATVANFSSVQRNATGGTDAVAASNAAVKQFLPAVGTPLFFRTRINIDSITSSALIAGLITLNTTPLTAVADGIYFYNSTSDALLKLIVVKNSTATTSATIATLVNGEYVDVGFYFNGTEFEVYSGTNLITKVAATNIPDDEELTVTFGVQTGAAAARTMKIDRYDVGILR